MYYPGQRWISETESEYGIGTILAVEDRTVTVLYRAVMETRVYSIQTAPLTRVLFKDGETIQNNDGLTLCINHISTDEHQRLSYSGTDRHGKTHTIQEIDIDHNLAIHDPASRLLSGQLDDPRWFTLRLKAREYESMIWQSNMRGLQGARMSLVPHQLYIANQAGRQHETRALLADEVGLGKTIEACLILHRRIIQGLCHRALVIVPKPLVNQWLVELLRRFNLSFSIFNEERCQDLESDDQENPFLQSQLVLCTLNLFERAGRQQQALDAGWDMLIVDEAHHLHWTPGEASPEYQIIEAFSAHIRSVLLLTATPEQLGKTGHFARLRLLDAKRFNDLDKFLQEEQAFEPVADLAEALLERETLDASMKSQLESYGVDIPGDQPIARQRAARQLVDLHGTSRLLFRNTRKTIQGFPERQLFPYPLPHTEPLPTQFSDAVFETLLENDPRIEWLIQQVRRLRPEKCLLICSKADTALALEDILLKREGIRCAAFHEGLSIIQRDRAAAWFAQAGGAEILLCSEIGSEGRNFQFAHHLILFDLPLNPDLLEQRIGRLDRIGQCAKVSIHVPYIENTVQARLLEWYRQATRIFHEPDPVATQVFEELSAAGFTGLSDDTNWLERSITRSRQLRDDMQQGRDRLLSLSSFNADSAAQIVEDIKASDEAGILQPFMEQVYDLFGIDSEHHSAQREVISPGDHMVGGQFPFLQTDGTLITYDRTTALAHEDTQFLTWDHPMVTGAIDTVTSGEFGSACLHLITHDIIPAGISLLELLYRIDCPAPAELPVKRYIEHPTLRLLLDSKGRNMAGKLPHEQLTQTASQIDKAVARQAIKTQANDIEKLITGSRQRADKHLEKSIRDAAASIRLDIDEELQRLDVLRKHNPNIQASDLTVLEQQRQDMLTILGSASIRLDAVRLVIITD